MLSEWSQKEGPNRPNQVPKRKSVADEPPSSSLAALTSVATRGRSPDRRSREGGVGALLSCSPVPTAWSRDRHRQGLATASLSVLQLPGCQVKKARA